jgi:hypothetical protein
MDFYWHVVSSIIIRRIVFNLRPIGIKEEYDLTESEIVTSSSTLCSKATVYEVKDDSSDDDE